MPEASLFNKRAWVALLAAIVLVIGGELILAWQYHRLEQSRLPQIEQELQRQQQAFEERDAKDILVSFLDARLLKNEVKATSLLTEQSVEQLAEGRFMLFGDFVLYEIQETRRNEDGSFRFQVALLSPQGFTVQLELIELKEVLGDYYIHSLELAG